MYQFTLLAKVRQPAPTLLRRMVESFTNQTAIDGELVLVTTATDQPAAEVAAAGHPRVRIVIRLESELLPWACHALSATLGTWVGFLGQHDRLTPDALTSMLAAAQPASRVIYSDEETPNDWGLTVRTTSKGELDPVRLLSQEYLRDLVLISSAWLTATGGFLPEASDSPTHDLYLRTLIAEGAPAFTYVPQVLYQRQQYPLTANRPYLPDYDLQAVRQHYERIGLPAKVKPLNGTLTTVQKLPRHPAVTVLAQLGDDTAAGKQLLHAIVRLPTYQPWTVSVLYAGSDPVAAAYYDKLCAGMKLGLTFIGPDLPGALNQEAARADTELVLFLQAMPLTPYWLKQLVDLVQLPGIAATGGRLMTPTRLTEPGCPGALDEGLPWDARGSFNQLSVPHSVSVLSPACLLVVTRKFLNAGGFDPNLPTLYGMDLCLRLNQAGERCARTPRVQMQASPGAAAEPAELALFRARWADWRDPYGLHQLP